MNSDHLTKATAAICIAGLTFLFSKWGAEIIFDRGHAGGGHGEIEQGDNDNHGTQIAQAYSIEVAGGDEDHSDADENTNAWAIAMAAADAGSGEKVFNKCKACHSLEAGKNGVGPSLANVVGKPAGQASGFDYSTVMAESGLTWNEETLFAFLGDVKGTVPGTKMSFAGLKKESDRANVVAYLMGSDFDAGTYASMTEASTDSADHSTDGDDAGEANEETEMASMTLPAGDAEKGQKVFNKCKACHKVGAGENGVGPTMFQIVGRAAGSVPDYKYSTAMADSGLTWDDATLAKFLQDVKGTVPGTKMGFGGLKKEQDVADIIAYLSTLK